MAREDEGNFRDERNEEYIAYLVERQFSVLEETSSAIDAKAATLLGFVAVIAALVVQVAFPSNPTYLDIALFFVSLGLLLAGLLLQVLCIAPKWKRFDPDPTVLVKKYWTSSLESTRKAVACNLADVWAENRRVHKKKTRFFEWGLYLTVMGLFLLVFDILVIRTFGI